MFHLWIDNEIPLARGMGSSAAAIIAGITCYEILTGDQLDEQEFFRCAFDFEDHPDNLGACLYGGLIAGVSTDDGTVQVARLQIPCRLSTVVVIPSFELSTGVARAVLPKTYSFHDIIYNTQTIRAHDRSADDMQQEAASRSDARSYPSALSRQTDSRARRNPGAPRRRTARRRAERRRANGIRLCRARVRKGGRRSDCGNIQRVTAWRRFRCSSKLIRLGRVIDP